VSTQTTRQLSVNITTTNTWTQLKDIATGAVYAAPAGGRADVRWLKAINYDTDAVTVEFALSVTSTITDDERLLPPISITQYQQVRDTDGLVLPATWGLWARAVGTTPNATFLAFVLEIAP